MYSQYFGLSEPPFSIAPDPRFLYMSDQHREALAHLLYGIGSNGGFVLLTGEVGTGKTTVTRCLLEQLPESTDVAFVLNPKYTVEELLETICDELAISVEREGLGIKEYVDAINGHLIENHRRNRNTVLIIDEAQNLSVDVLETIRLLTNLETNTKKLLQIILVGQPELSDLLEQQALRQLNQRITARYHLRALHQDEIQSYLNHRLAVAGVDCPLFQPGSIKRLYKLTKGIPRLINIICDRALLGAYVQRESTVKAEVLGKAAGEVLGDSKDDHSNSWLRVPVMAVVSLIVIGVIFVGSFFTSPQLKAWVSSTELIQPPSSEVLNSQSASLEDEQSASAVITPEDEKFGSVPLNQKSDIPDLVNEDIEADDKLHEVRAAPVIKEGDTAVVAQSQPPESVDKIAITNPANWAWENKSEAELSEVLAYQHLFSLWGIEFQPKEDPAVCTFAESNGLSCYFQVRSLSELASLNHPAVLKLLNAVGVPFYVTLVEINGEYADLYIAESKRRVALKDLKLWSTGNITLLWRKPQNYRHPLLPGAQGDLITWLDQQLAVVQGRNPRTPSPEIYDEALVWQVKKFQSSFGLMADGVVGPKTAMQLAAVTSQSIPKLRE